MFAEDKYNALYSALFTSAKDSGYSDIYDYLENCAKTSFIASLVDALEEHGYCITKLSVL